MENTHRAQVELPTPPADPRSSARHRLSRYTDYSIEKQLLVGNDKVSEDALKHLEFLNQI